MRDGHVRVLPLHVANKIAAGEVVERPASVVKELVENSIDAGAKSIRIAISQGGRKLVSVQDDGCGMTRDDAVLSLERQATSKILDAEDIERIDTLGFRGEAIPSIASVSRFTLTTRRRDSDEGTMLQVNAGTLAEVRPAGSPPGTLVEVRDLFCNIPARRKFLRSYATEESHVRQIYTVHALAHPEIAFSLTVDGREAGRLPPAANTADRVRDLFGPEFTESMLLIPDPPGEATGRSGAVRVSGFVERPNLACPTRREQYVFVNGRPASAPSVAYAIREAYPRRQGDARPAVILFIELDPGQVDVNVHPTKREVRFRDNVAVKAAVTAAIGRAIGIAAEPAMAAAMGQPTIDNRQPAEIRTQISPTPSAPVSPIPPVSPVQPHSAPTPPYPSVPAATTTPAPVEAELKVSVDGEKSKPWRWFKFLAQPESGYLLIETDAGIVTINPVAARERIVYERLKDVKTPSQPLLIPETVRLSPVDYSRLAAAMDALTAMGFALEPFGQNTFKIDAIPQIASSLSAADLLATISRDLSEPGQRRGGERWREELIAKSVARSFAGAPIRFTPEAATKLVEELCSCRMPYVCPRGKPVMIFTSTRELDRKFDRA